MNADEIKAAPAFDLVQYLLGRRPRFEAVDIFGHPYEVREVCFKDRHRMMPKEGEDDGDYVARLICATVYEPWPSKRLALTPEAVGALPVALANKLMTTANKLNSSADPLSPDEPGEAAPEPLLEETQAEKNA